MAPEPRLLAAPGRIPPPGRYYWRTQLLSWSGYALFNLVLFNVFVPRTAQGAWTWIFSLVIAATLLGASHLLRRLLLGRGWLKLSPRALLGRLLLANALLAGGSEVVIGLLATLVLPAQPAGAQPQGWLPYLGYVLNLSVMLWLWTAAYLGWHYLQRSRRAEIEKWQLTAAVREAELNTLRAQLNPHFLFNGLNNIRALVSENPGRARQALAHLAELLRYVMQHNTTPLVPLRQEMSIVADYLALEALQLEDRLRYTLAVDPAAEEARLPPLTVQLLVENAIKHGIASRPAGGFIEVAAQLDEAGCLQLRVRSTGQYHPPAVPAPVGLGLRTLRERLGQAFGARAHFYIGNDPAVPDTVLATLQLPATPVSAAAGHVAASIPALAYLK